MSIKLTNASSSEIVKCLDHTGLISQYEKLGISVEEMNTWNSFIYAIIPEGAHGKFVIPASDASKLFTNKHEINLEFGCGSDKFTFKNLLAQSIQYFEVPTTSWDISGTGDQSRHIAVVELVDFWDALTQVLSKDYNRISTFSLKNNTHDREPLFGSLKSYQEIFTDILSTTIIDPNTLVIDGVEVTYSMTGMPDPAYFKPVNVLTAGTDFTKFVKLITDMHFLVAYSNNNPTDKADIVITNAQTGSVLNDKQLLWSKYGPPSIPEHLVVTFSENAGAFSKLRSQLLIDYYGSVPNRNWATEYIDTDNSTDSTLQHTVRTATANSYDLSVYYPYHDTGKFGSSSFDGHDVTSLMTTLKNNYKQRCLRELDLLFNGLVPMTPSATVNRITYSYRQKGWFTRIESFPPEIISVPPITNQVARGLEYVPPFLRGTVTNTGDNWDANRVGYPPGSEAEIELPDISAIIPDSPTPFKIRVICAGTQQMFTDDVVGVHYNSNTREYEFTDMCERLFQFRLRTNWYGGIALADRLTMDGVETGGIVVLRDPLSIYGELQSGGKGYMSYNVNDRYYAVNAPCATQPYIPPTEPTGACCVGSVCIGNMSATDCTAAHGTWKGAGTSCSDSPDPCYTGE